VELGENQNQIGKTEESEKWLDELKDLVGKQAIIRRLKRARKGNFGECKPVGGGVFEMVIHYGPGYRLYYFQRGPQLYWLLMGGTKGTQPQDVERAKAMKRDIEGGGER
jgi:putative addiction module killer protein